MAKILYVSTYGQDDPTRATLPFVAALGAQDAGHQPGIALMGEATFLMKSYIAEEVHGVGWPALNELLRQAIEHKIPVYV